MGIPQSQGHSRSYEVVWEFERRVASFAGAKHGVATDSCSSALFLACKYEQVGEVTLPSRTYISVPAAVVHAGGRIKFRGIHWVGVYQLYPYSIWDGAMRFKRGMYAGGLHCVSFQSRKHIPIGKGGMVLTDDSNAASWLRRARSNGRDTSVPYSEDAITMLGWNMAMTPEQAARGLQLLESYSDRPDIEDVNYPDLRHMPVFKDVE